MTPCDYIMHRRLFGQPGAREHLYILDEEVKAMLGEPIRQESAGSLQDVRELQVQS